MKKVIEIKQLSKSYKKRKSIIKVLENVSYQFELGKFYVIMGNSGSGKTTLIQLLGLFLEDYEGNISINGQDISTLSENQKAYTRNQEIGFIFQSFYLNPVMKAYENVMLPMYINNNIPIKDMKKIAFQKLKHLGLEGRETHFPKELSGGEQQRVAIARALVNDPNIILADEPTGSLDAENEELILKELKKLAKAGKCVIIVSHSQAVKNYADKIINIKDRKLV